MESSHFLPVSSPCGTALYKTFFPKFTPKNSQLHKIAYNSACMADRPEMFAPRGFSGMADSAESCKMLWGRPLSPRQRNLRKFGLFFDKIGVYGRQTGYVWAYQARQPWGPIFVAIATTFALGAESNRLPACGIVFSASFIGIHDCSSLLIFTLVYFRVSTV